MKNRKVIYFSLLISLALALIFGIIVLALGKQDNLKVVFLDVGQGDAILIVNGSNQVLIDGGRNGKVLLEKLGKNMPFWDRKIEAVVITHPDADHYGGFKDLLDFYKIENIIRTNAENTSGEWLSLKEKIASKNSQEIKSTYGTNIVFPCGANMQIIYPFLAVNENRKDTNNSSIVTKLTFGENEFLFTGDLSSEGEGELLNSGLDVRADFLKIGHHGSKHSSGDNFLDKVSAQDAIISVGSKNSYGHPTQEVLTKLKNRAVRIWRTDQDGTVKYNCKNISQKCQAVGAR